MIKYCRLCLNKYEATLADVPNLKYCTVCSGALREVRIENGVEIFLNSIPEDNIMDDGMHLGCEGYTERRQTSSKDLFIHVCRGCYCRIYENIKGE